MSSAGSGRTCPLANIERKKAGHSRSRRSQPTPSNYQAHCIPITTSSWATPTRRCCRRPSWANPNRRSSRATPNGHRRSARATSTNCNSRHASRATSTRRRCRRYSRASPTRRSSRATSNCHRRSSRACCANRICLFHCACSTANGSASRKRYNPRRGSHGSRCHRQRVASTDNTNAMGREDRDGI